MAGPKPPGPPPPPPSGRERRAASRAGLAVPVRLRYESVLDFVETQSMNISRTGMFIVTETPAPLGSQIAFEFSLADGFVLLRGLAEVVRVASGGIVEGMGVRFLDLDDATQAVIERIVAVNTDEGRVSTLTFDFSRPATSGQMAIVRDDQLDQLDAPAPSPPAPPRAAAPAPAVQFDGAHLRLTLGRDTVHHFTTNPLANARSGGFTITTELDVPLGGTFTVEIVDAGGQALLSGKGKVLTKQDRRLGVRLQDVPKEVLARLQDAVAKLAPSK